MNGLAPSAQGDAATVCVPTFSVSGERNSTETAEYAGP